MPPRPNEREKLKHIAAHANDKLGPKTTAGFWGKLFVLFVVTVGILSGVEYVIAQQKTVSLVETVFIVPLLAAIIATLEWFFLERAVQKSSDVKYKFLTVASHRIRTPLTRAQWSVESLKDEVSTEAGKELLKNIESTIQELSEISGHLLDAAEAGEGSLYYDYIFESGSLGVLARQVVADYTPGILQKNLSMTVDIEENLPFVYLDKERLRMAAGAMLENAILYTPSGGTIEMRVYREDDHLVFSIKDSGIGVPKDEQRMIFMEFYRTKEATSLDRDRAGLGISIAKEVIERHGGELYMSSEGKNRGSTFWFAIPIAVS